MNINLKLTAMKQNVYGFLCKCINQTLEENIQVNYSDYLNGDLGLDELDVVFICLEFKKEFSVDISIEDLPADSTVEDFVNAVCSLTKN